MPLTSYPGVETIPSFSPDSSQVVFQWLQRPGGIYDLYTKVVGSSGEFRLTKGSTNSFCAAWSPDGRFIAFLRGGIEARNDLFLISPLGGPERKLAALETPGCFSWHPNSKWLVIPHKEPGKESFALFSISIETGEERQLTFPSKDSPVDRDPAVSPRGDAVAFARGSQDLFLADLYVQPLADSLVAKGEPHRLTFNQRFNTQPAWAPDGRTIVFVSGAPHNPSLYELDRSWWGSWSSRPKLLSFAGDGVRNPVISSNGRLAFAKLTVFANIWRLELDSTSQAVIDPQKLIASTHLDHMPVYSPDGKRLAFASNRSGAHEIWLANSDGSGAVQLTSFGDAHLQISPPMVA